MKTLMSKLLGLVLSSAILLPSAFASDSQLLMIVLQYLSTLDTCQNIGIVVLTKLSHL